MQAGCDGHPLLAKLHEVGCDPDRCRLNHHRSAVIPADKTIARVGEFSPHLGCLARFTALCHQVCDGRAAGNWCQRALFRGPLPVSRKDILRRNVAFSRSSPIRPGFLTFTRIWAMSVAPQITCKIVGRRIGCCRRSLALEHAVTCPSCKSSIAPCS